MKPLRHNIKIRKSILSHRERPTEAQVTAKNLEKSKAGHTNWKTTRLAHNETCILFRRAFVK